MKTKEILYTLVAIILSLDCLSQAKGPEIIKNAPAALRKDDVFIGMITLKDNSYVLINTNDDQEFTFQRFDRNLKPISINSTALIYNIAKARNLGSIIQMKDKYYLSFQLMDKTDYLYSYYVIQFDPYSATFHGNMELIYRNQPLARGTINKIPNMHFGYRNLPNTVNCFYKEIQIEKKSADTSKFLIAYSYSDSASFRGNKMLKFSELEVVSDTERVQFNVLDQNMKKLWKREVLFRNKIEDYAINNEGHVYVLAKTDSTKNPFNSNFEVRIYKDSSSAPLFLYPKIDGKTIVDGKFFSPDRKNISIAGICKREKYWFYSISVFDTLSTASTNIQQIDLNTEGECFLREIKATNEGKYKFIYEDYWTKKYISKEEIDSRTEKGLIEEVFGNVRVISVDQKGSIEWETNIPKLQLDIKHASSIYTFLSFKSSAEKNPLRIYYIDNELNFNENWKTQTELGRHACLAEILVNSDGKITKHNIAKMDKLGGLKTKFYYSNEVMYTVNHLNKKNMLYKLRDY